MTFGPNHEIGFATARDLIQRLTISSMSSTELTEAFTQRIIEIDDCDGGLQSVLAISADATEQAATQSSVGSLRGLPVLIKDNIEAIGLPATAGSLALAGRTVKRDATIVTRLREAGATILGSTNLSEWANIRSPRSTSGWSAVGGLTANPWNYAHSAGGSSSGSGAAVAAGLIPFAVGTETDGSIVCPAALNGVVGIKPTVGSVSAKHVVPISSSQDVPGPIARNVADASLLLDVLSGLNTQSVISDTSRLRIGVVRQWLTGDDETNALFSNTVTALAASGIDCVPIDVPNDPEQANNDEGVVLLHELHDDLNAYLAARPGQGVSSLADVVAFNEDNPDSELGFFGQEYLEAALASRGRNAEYFEARARNLSWAAREVLGPALEKVDVLIGVPYAPAWVSRLGEGDDYSNASWMTSPAAIAGWPIASIPMGLVNGLPVGLGVVARALDEKGLVRALSRIERVIGQNDQVPTFVQ